MGEEKAISPGLQKIREQIERLKAREQAIVAREKQNERKERTRRLIQIGAMAEKYFGQLSLEEAEQLFEKLAKKEPAQS